MMRKMKLRRRRNRKRRANQRSRAPASRIWTSGLNSSHSSSPSLRRTRTPTHPLSTSQFLRWITSLISQLECRRKYRFHCLCLIYFNWLIEMSCLILFPAVIFVENISIYIAVNFKIKFPLENLFIYFFKWKHTVFILNMHRRSIC